MQEPSRLNPLRHDDPLRSPSGRYVLHYDAEGVAVITDTATGEITWRAGEPGAIAANGARELTLTDAGDLELLDGAGALIFNSRTGPVEPEALGERAPAAEITASRFLLHETDRKRRTVVRRHDGWLRIGEHEDGGGVHYALSDRLARWFEQDGTELTWLLLPDGRTPESKSWTLCLTETDEGDRLLWREPTRDFAPAPPRPEPHAYGGPELGREGRLRLQSLTSASGTHTLVHQSDGDLVLYCNPAHRAVWASNTGWAGGGWAELTADGDLVVRNLCGAQVWGSGTAGSGGRRLVVGDDGRVVLLDDADGVELWAVAEHAPCAEPGTDVARGAVLRRGQLLQRQSLTSDDGSTVFVHCDWRLVLVGGDGRLLWEQHIEDADRPSALVLDADGMLRVRAADGTVALELGGPADELRVVPDGLRLARTDGTVVWSQGTTSELGAGGELPAEDFTSWMDALTGGTGYCATVIHDISPDEALRRLDVDPEDVNTGTFGDLLTQSEVEDVDFEDLAVAAFALGPHTLLVEDNGWAGVDSPQLSAGTFAVSSCKTFSAASYFAVYRDGKMVADHSEDREKEPSTPEVRAALAAMGADDASHTAFRHGLELLCRTAGVRPTIADVTGVARWAIVIES